MSRKPERDEKIIRLFKEGLTGREIARRLRMRESAVWSRIQRSGLERRRGPGRYGIPRQRKPHARITSPWTALARFHEPVLLDEADLPDGRDGFIVFIGDKPGCACATPEAAVRSAIAARS